MAMHITIQSNFALPLAKTDQLLAVVNTGMQEFIRQKPFSVQITPNQRTAVVTINNTIRVQHGHHFKHKVLSKFNSNFVIRYQELKRSIKHVTCLRFTRVYSRSEDYWFLVSVIFEIFTELAPEILEWFLRESILMTLIKNSNFFLKCLFQKFLNFTLAFLYLGQQLLTLLILLFILFSDSSG